MDGRSVGVSSIPPGAVLVGERKVLKPRHILQAAFQSKAVFVFVILTRSLHCRARRHLPRQARPASEASARKKKKSRPITDAR